MYNIRFGQTAEWGEFIRSKELSKDEGVIFAGDFNIDAYTEELFNNVLINLGAVIPKKVGDMNYTTDGSFNDLGGSSPNWIDHVLYSGAHLVPKESTVQIIAPTVDEGVSICWCSQCVNLRGYMYADSTACKEVRHVKHLADHQPVIGTFIF